MWTKTILFVTISGIIGFVAAFGPKAGPYDIEVEKGHRCDDEGLGIMAFGTKITHVGRGQYMYNETFILGRPIDEHFKLKAELQKWGNGGWRPKSFGYTIKNCKEVMEFLGELIRSVMKTAGVENVTCPIPAGKYKANKWLINRVSIEKEVPVMEYGRYRAFLQFFYKKELIGCHVVYGAANPKEQQ